jgi:IMP dehydrogenase
MTRDVQIANPNQTIHDVAQIMAECDVGCLPVGENNRLVGMITDRDIAVRAVAKGKSPDQTKVRDIMTQDVKYCFDDQEVTDVAQNMSDVQVHRLPVVDHDKHLVGILALSDIANCEGAEAAGNAVCGISHPAEQSGSSGAGFSSH